MSKKNKKVNAVQAVETVETEEVKKEETVKTEKKTMPKFLKKGLIGAGVAAVLAAGATVLMKKFAKDPESEDEEIFEDSEPETEVVDTAEQDN